jgi:tRNA A-37 threonylcarbamoyl transferase component Bud32
MGSAAAAETSVVVPGYEIIRELGRGGMGVVYQARQTKLNRPVALKMILAGSHAGAGELARFQTEAEAIARLRHPNIVQVYEVGDHEGKPYFSLEFCSGGSLEKKLNGTPLPPREAASLVETLAKAMQAAHEQHVIHRDLKPANVLLAEDGTPKITGFGLAKKLDEAGQTQSGAIMGTPSYMAPEQAGGTPSQIGPLADVYALGAILYECLTGRPPFKAPTSLDTILQVVGDEPVPVRQLQPHVPADLETICLKCLRKEAARRYESAAALADDLRRFLEGRPVVARPVGRWERAAKWVRRNPALAGAAAAVVLALLLGTAFSTGFAIDASRQAAKARENEADAVAKGKELAAANDALTRTADDLETTLARSLLRPLGLQGGDKPVIEAEWDALWELAANRHRGRLGYAFVEEASRAPAASRQLRDRAALALSAAVGLDAERRGEVEGLVLARLADPALGAEKKTDLALALSAWDGLSDLGVAATARQLIAAMNNTRDPPALGQLAECLSALLSPVPAAEIPTRSAAAASAVAFPTDIGHRPAALVLLIPAAEPAPCRLSTQQLVELLKMPGYVGAAQRIVLDHLGNRYHRTFPDLWEFVRFTKEQRLDLDFTSPPQRPGPAAVR